MSAAGIGIFSTAYTTRNQCIADAKQVIGDYSNVLGEWTARLQPLAAILDMHSMAEVTALIQQPETHYAFSRLKDSTPNELLVKLRQLREEIDFSVLKDEPSTPPKVPEPVQNLEVTRQAAQFLATTIKYDDRMSPDLSEGMVATVTYIGFPDEALADLQTALMNTIVLSTKENFRLARVTLRPNCSYGTVLARMVTGNETPIVSATLKAASPRP